MQTKRVNLVFDQCLLQGHPSYAWHASAWHQNGLISQTTDIKNGYIDTICRSRILRWERVFTRDACPPHFPPNLSHALVEIMEWVPGVWPTHPQAHGWKRMGQTKYHGVTNIADHSFIAQWSTHAKRHLRVFTASGAVIETGSFEDIERGAFQSQVPPAMTRALLMIVKHRLMRNPEDINIIVAKKDGEIIAGFVSGYDKHLKESMYILGYFLPQHAKLQAMTGLVAAWMQRTRDIGGLRCNFGGMCGAYPSLWDPWLGLSQFKTHFNIQRFWLPPSFWKIRLSLPWFSKRKRAPSQSAQ